LSENSSRGPEKRTLFLIDGSSYIYRAYHAVRGLTTREGFPTNAIFGFTNMLLKVLKEHEPDYVALVLDSPGPTFRHDIFPEYKANRPPMPDDLKVQIPEIHGLSGAFNVRMIRKDGYEADDIIATVADRFSNQVDRTVIVSSDKDLMQLVSDSVVMLDTMKDRWIGEAEVEERFGVKPEMVPDVQALMGDPTDNIPGVSGVGPKTAGKLVSEYGDLDSVLAHSSEIPGKAGRTLSESTEDAMLSLSLVTLDRNVPLEVTLDDMTAREPDRDSLREIFSRLQFSRFMKELSPTSSLSREAYRLILSGGDLASLTECLRSTDRFALDVETDSKDPVRARLVGISFSWEPGEAAYYSPRSQVYRGSKTA